MPYYCTVPRCTSMAGKAKNVSFHQFPRDEELAKLWNNILKRGKPYTKYSKVCSLHFRPEDYSITSAGKNKGQWRTLRKDAIPSQNLPSDSPTPYQRRQSGAWLPNTAPSIMDPMLQQHVAQAIYMQTMLAMHSAGSTDSPTLQQDSPEQEPVEDSSEPTPHPSFLSQDRMVSDETSTEQTDQESSRSSYKCDDCSKCFKDPDVFTLHRRVHVRAESAKETEHSTSEKENLRNNPDTLKSNPILANLLKSQETNIFDRNILIENQLMTVLASNMESYIRNLSSMMTQDGRECDNIDDIEANRLVIDESV